MALVRSRCSVLLDFQTIVRGTGALLRRSYAHRVRATLFYRHYTVEKHVNIAKRLNWWPYSPALLWISGWCGKAIVLPWPVSGLG